MSSTETPVVYEDLAWGLNTAVPVSAPAAWGARAIYRYGDAEFDVSRHRRRSCLLIVHDRQSGSGDPADLRRLIAKLNDGLLEEARTAVDRAVMRDDEQRQVELVRKNGVVIVGDTLASGGYLYLAAWLEENDND